MSTATDLAELDAAIAENELGDLAAARLRELVEEGAPVADALEQLARETEPEAVTGSPDPQPEPPSSEPTDKQLKALDRETTRHLESVQRIMGSFVGDFTPCSECDGLGLVPPGPQPKAHPYFRTCETCAGFGQVLTGSLRENRNARDCPECGGNGYLEALGPGGVPLAENPGASLAPAAPPPPQEATTETGAAVPAAAPVTFGRPAWMGDPSIGQ